VFAFAPNSPAPLDAKRLPKTATINARQSGGNFERPSGLNEASKQRGKSLELARKTGRDIAVNDFVKSITRQRRQIDAWAGWQTNA
jgi:hypothetical protein